MLFLSVKKAPLCIGRFGITFWPSMRANHFPEEKQYEDDFTCATLYQQYRRPSFQNHFKTFFISDGGAKFGFGKQDDLFGLEGASAIIGEEEGVLA